MGLSQGKAASIKDAKVYEEPVEEVEPTPLPFGRGVADFQKHDLMMMLKLADCTKWLEVTSDSEPYTVGQLKFVILEAMKKLSDENL